MEVTEEGEGGLGVETKEVMKRARVEGREGGEVNTRERLTKVEVAMPIHTVLRCCRGSQC